MNELYFSRVTVKNRNSRYFGRDTVIVVSSPNRDAALQRVEDWKDRYDIISSFKELNIKDANEKLAGRTYVVFTDE